METGKAAPSETTKGAEANVASAANVATIPESSVNGGGKLLNNKAFDILFGWAQNRNPVVTMAGTVVAAAATLGTSLITNNPNIIGAVSMAGVGYVCIPQMLTTLRLKLSKDPEVASEAAKSLNLEFLTLNGVACALYTAYGFAIGSIPLIAADIACFMFGTVPMAIKVKEVLNEGDHKFEVKNVEGETEKVGAFRRVWSGVKEKLHNPTARIAANAAMLAATAGIITYSVATNANPDIVGGIAAASVGILYAPQALYTFKARNTKGNTDGMSYETVLVDTSSQLMAIPYAAMLGAVPLIASGAVATLFSGVVTVIKVRDMMRDWAKKVLRVEATDSKPGTEQKD